MKLTKASEMRALDSCAVEDFGIPSIVLMENAGLGTVLMMEQELGDSRGSFAIILVGPGNNGGDGLVIGRHLHQRGCEPVFFFLIDPDSLQGDAATNLQIVKNLRLPYHVVNSPTRIKTVNILFKQIESRGKPCYAIVDALFGTGLKRDIVDHFETVIDLVNRPDFAHNIPVVSVDIPSGMNSDRGSIYNKSIIADHTATYGCPKPGLVLHGSSDLTGKLHVIDIGIPPEAIARANIQTDLLTEDSIKIWLSKLTRSKGAHKGNHGHLFVLAGSLGKTGAAILSVHGALRGGCGLVTLASPKNLNVIYESRCIEAMTTVLPDSEDFLTDQDTQFILDSLEDKQCLVMGPGIGSAPQTSELALTLYHEVTLPMVIDADGINILALLKHRLGSPAGPRIFTPHPGELGRLLGKTSKEIQDNRLQHAQEACSLLPNDHNQKIIFVLKGAGTIIATNDGKLMINTTGNPGMATGGMGDVLSGVIASLICQGFDCLEASGAGVFLHGLAGDIVYEKQGIGFTATELADAIPEIVKRYVQ